MQFLQHFEPKVCCRYANEKEKRKRKNKVETSTAAKANFFSCRKHLQHKVSNFELFLFLSQSFGVENTKISLKFYSRKRKLSMQSVHLPPGKRFNIQVKIFRWKNLNPTINTRIVNKHWIHYMTFNMCRDNLPALCRRFSSPTRKGTNLKFIGITNRSFASYFYWPFPFFLVNSCLSYETRWNVWRKCFINT